jgi:phosphoglycolate phosphatase-like HAD superfamily hydrolase
LTEIRKFVKPEDSLSIQQELYEQAGVHEIAVVKNPGYVYPPYDFYPLPPRSKGNLPGVRGILCDMDGTTTTTEALCLHSLEHMVRRITNRMSPAEWDGLDQVKDYPHIIGNSTTRHVEYLIRTYEDRIDGDALGISFLRAALWTLSVGRDPNRMEDVRSNLEPLGLKGLLKEPIFENMIKMGQYDSKEAEREIVRLWEHYRELAKINSFDDIVRAAIDIYYMRYHEILAELETGSASKVAREILGDPDILPIEPMPGVGIFLALIKGWLGEQAMAFGPELLEACLKLSELPDHLSLESHVSLLPALGQFFSRQPAKIGIVTSSIRYEMHIVLKQVFDILHNDVEQWPVDEEVKDKARQGFVDYRKFYDAAVSATDSSEIRLKPHRDLFCIALHRMGISPGEFDQVVGFEDSESGTIAIRAAGIGLCVAVPFADTAGHDLSAAAFVLKGGLPEAILRRLVFLNPEALKI